MKRAIAPCALLALSSLAACAGHETATVQTVAPPPSVSHQISVEIPLDGWQVEGHDLLRVNQLLDERTEFDADDFRLDELILIARSDDPVHAGSAEVLVLDWRSGEFDIPQGGTEDWFEVRIPIGEEDPSGAWLLDVEGDVTIDLLVAVLEPPAEVVKERTVYRTRTIYRDVVDVYPRTYQAFWIYDPMRYYTVHYHGGIWPYRYFIGPWDFRYYDLAYRPHHLGFVHYRRYRDDRRYRRGWRDDRRRPRIDEPLVRDVRDDRRERRMAALKRSHPRLRLFHRQDHNPAPPSIQPPREETALERWERQKREHPRLRALHRDKPPADTSRPALGGTESRRQPVAGERTRATRPPSTAARSQPRSRADNDVRTEDAPAAIAPRRTAIQPRGMPTLRRGNARTPAVDSTRTVTRSVQRPVATAPRPVPTLRRSTTRSPATTRTDVRPRSAERSSQSALRPRVQNRVNSVSRSVQRRAAPTPVTPRQMPTMRSSSRAQPAIRSATPSRSISPRPQRQASAPRSQPRQAPPPPRQTAAPRSSTTQSSRASSAPNSRARVFER